MNGKKWKTGMKAVGMFVVCGLMLAGLTGFVSAAIDDDPPNSPQPSIPVKGVHNFFEGALVRTFRYQSSMVNFIASSLAIATDSSAAAQRRMEALINDGQDVASLEEALAEYLKLLDEAKTANDSARDIVDRHRGFDAKGKVLNIQDAGETIKAVGPYLQTARENIVAALQVVHQAISEYSPPTSR